MKAWMYERELTDNAVPPEPSEDNEEAWDSYVREGRASDNKLFNDWISEVPGSKAPCDVVTAAVQSMYNRGYDVSEAEKYLDEGLKAAREKNGAALQVLTAKVYKALNNAKKRDGNQYDNFTEYRDFSQIKESMNFPEPCNYDVESDDFREKIKAGWWGQLIGGCLGTQIEGYTTKKIREKFGDVREYLRKPETYNDDITYELAYLDVFINKGYSVTSEDVAFAWLELISDGYSAERTALENLRKGIMPPESGRFCNYFSDWIGAQMRTPIHGMLAPGNPILAARIAADDSVVSHSNNGVLGGVFNALLTSLAFTEKDIRTLLTKAIEMLPHDSEYYEVVSSTLYMCKSGDNWEDVWRVCEDKYKEYNWIHAYPNAAAEVIALWYGNMDFNETCRIIATEGQDVDCSAAPILNALAIIIGLDKIEERWIKPIGDVVLTTMRRMQEIKIEELCEMTTESVRNALKKSGKKGVFELC